MNAHDAQRSVALAQHIRIAIAAVALAHKPPEQSFSCSSSFSSAENTSTYPGYIAYILDLKAKFPASKSQVESVSQEDPWRLRALALEEENEMLKIRAQKHELEILALKTAPTGVEGWNTELESSQAAKKKRKVTQSTSKGVPYRLDLRVLVKDIRSGPRLPVLRDTLDILTSFHTVLLSDVCPAVEMETTLIPNIKRSLVALGRLLTAILARDGSVVAASSRVDVTNCLCNLLLALLNSTLPLATRDTILPHILGDLTICLVRPIIQAFHALSMREIACAIKEDARKANDIDLRPNLLNILQRLIECLRTLKMPTRGLREFMVFETAKEIESLWNVVPVGGERSREQRMERISRKDSLWYQCSVLHVALDRFPPSRTREASRDSLLSSEAVRVLANLIRYFERGSPVDDVAKNIVLGVLEKAWLNGLYESPVTS